MLSLLTLFCLFTVGLALVGAAIVAVTRSSNLQSYLVFLHWVNPIPVWLISMDKWKPSNCDSIRFRTTDGIELGAWLMRPGDAPPKPTYDRVVLYFHGNAASRRSIRRMKSYLRLLQIFEADALFTIDYRGFADSEGFPTETGVLCDALSTYQYVVNELKPRQLFVWGHSLGSGVATGLVTELKQKNISPLPLALFLEAPFRSIPDAAVGHYVGAPLRLLPATWREKVTSSLVHRFPTEVRISQGLPCPLMLLHARNDGVIDVEHSRILAERARATGIKMSVLFLEKEGHNGITLTTQIDQPIRDFIAPLVREIK